MFHGDEKEESSGQEGQKDDEEEIAVSSVLNDDLERVHLATKHASWFCFFSRPSPEGMPAMV